MTSLTTENLDDLLSELLADLDKEHIPTPIITFDFDIVDGYLFQAFDRHSNVLLAAIGGKYLADTQQRMDQFLTEFVN